MRYRPLLFGTPADTTRRRQIVDLMISMDNLSSSGNPALAFLQGAGLSDVAMSAVTTPADRYNEVTGKLIGIFHTLDLPEGDEEVLNQIRIPQTASAPAVTRSQAQALQRVGHNLDQNLPLTPSEAGTLAEKHEAYVAAGSGVKAILRGVERGRAAGSVARTFFQDKARAYVERRIAELPKEDPRRNTLISRLSIINTMTTSADTKAEASHRRTKMAKAEVLNQLHSAEADLELTKVMAEVRENRVTDLDALLRAAKHLRTQSKSVTTVLETSTTNQDDQNPNPTPATHTKSANKNRSRRR